MSAPLPDKPHTKRRSYFVTVFSETWKETELRDVIIMDLVGTVMTLFLAFIFHVAGWDEIKQLIFLAFVGGACGVIASFTYRFFFVAPAKLYRELEEKLDNSESKLAERDKIRPLEIEALLPKMLSALDVYACEICVHNENQSVNRAKLRLVTVEPPFLGTDRPSNLCDLDYIKFSLDGTPESVLAGKSDCRIPIFTVTRTAQGIFLTFSGTWASEWENAFSPTIKSEDGEHGMRQVFAEHILTFETSATGVDAYSTQFKLSFSIDRNKPPFAIEKIIPPQAINSLESGPDKTQDKTKKHTDPASVIVLLCLSASLLVIVAAQRFQISKLTNPPTLKRIAKKPLPDTIIPRPVTSNILPIAPQVTNAESPIQFDTNIPSTDSGDFKSKLDALRAKKLAEKEADRKERQSDSDNRWKTNLHAYQDCIETFYNILKSEADRRNEGIAKTVNYFKCLPSTINYDLAQTNVAEIRFQNETNVNFKIAIMSDINRERGLRIYGGCCGLFEFYYNIHTGDRPYNISLHIPGCDDIQTLSFDQYHALIEDYLKSLVAAQFDYLSETNHAK